MSFSTNRTILSSKAGQRRVEKLAGQCPGRLRKNEKHRPEVAALRLVDGQRVSQLEGFVDLTSPVFECKVGLRAESDLELLAALLECLGPADEANFTVSYVSAVRAGIS